MASKKDGDVARVAGLRYWRLADAEVVVDAWQQSGEDLRTFAERYGIRPRRLRRWAARVAEEAEPMRFHPIRLVQGRNDEHRSGEVLEVVLGEACTVRVPPGFAAEDLERVLDVLEARC